MLCERLGRVLIYGENVTLLGKEFFNPTYICRSNIRVLMNSFDMDRLKGKAEIVLIPH